MEYRLVTRPPLSALSTRKRLIRHYPATLPRCTVGRMGLVVTARYQRRSPSVVEVETRAGVEPGGGRRERRA